MKPKVGEPEKVEIGAMVRIDCPAWFRREDFQKWLNGERVATWHRKGQEPCDYSDAFVTYDWDEGRIGLICRKTFGMIFVLSARNARLPTP